MTGTAATMQIEENLALAARRGKPRTLRIGITKQSASSTVNCSRRWIWVWKTA